MGVFANLVVGFGMLPIKTSWFVLMRSWERIKGEVMAKKRRSETKALPEPHMYLPSGMKCRKEGIIVTVCDQGA